MNLDLIIGISGRISSGKSTIAKKLSEKFKIPILSFGGYLLQYSKENNLPFDRGSLQNLGDKFIKADPSLFLQNVLSASDSIPSKMIVEGIRHQSIFNLLKKSTEKFYSAFINAPIESRFQWYIKRRKESDAEVTFDEFKKLDQHIVESELDLIRDKCQLQIYSESISDKELYSKFSEMR